MNKWFNRLPLFGFVTAIALVLATSAFKQAPKDKNGDTMYTFEYNPPTAGDYSASSEQNVANWSYVSDDSRCTDFNNKACRIYVTEDYVDNPTTDPVLDSSINITTAAGTGSNNYVNSTAAGSGHDYVSNKAN